MALGQAIVTELEHDRRGEVLQRWLAHHLAELMAAVDRETGAAKAEAEARAVDVILKLWTHRRALPEAVDPLGGVRDAVAVLGRLMPESNPWEHDRYHCPYEHLLKRTFQTLSRVVVGGIVLTQLTQPRAISEPESAALEDEEIAIRATLDKWVAVVARAPNVPQIDVSWNTETAGENSEDGGPQRSDLIEGEGEATPARQAAVGVEDVRDAIIKNLEQAQSDLTELLERWKAAAIRDVKADTDRG